MARLSNLGGTFPKFFVLKAVDILTVATCHPGTSAKDTAFTDPFSCVAEAGKAHCTELGGKCVIERDGYYWVNILCVIIGLITFVTYIRKTLFRLQALQLGSWRLGGITRHLS
jgi:PAT family acetyl-CoA transporter-like MFS transporter 1